MSVDLYPLASLEQIENTPSRLDGIPAELEEDLRAYGCKLITEAGVLLNQCVVSTIGKLALALTNSKKTSRGRHGPDTLPSILVCHFYEAVWHWCQSGSFPDFTTTRPFNAFRLAPSLFSFASSRTSEWVLCTLLRNSKSALLGCAT
jgi:hypothetical protein